MKRPSLLNTLSGLNGNICMAILLTGIYSSWCALCFSVVLFNSIPHLSISVALLAITPPRFDLIAQEDLSGFIYVQTVCFQQINFWPIFFRWPLSNEDCLPSLVHYIAINEYCLKWQTHGFCHFSLPTDFTGFRSFTKMMMIILVNWWWRRDRWKR